MTASLVPYQEMKASGVAWLGDVPAHWDIRRLRALAHISTGAKDTIDRRDDGKYPFFVRSQNVEKIDTWSFDGEAVLTAGDGHVGKIFHYVNGRFDYHQRVYKLSDFRQILGAYFFHYFRSTFQHEVFQGTAKSTVESLRLPMLQSFPVVLPTLPEQTAIARFLDHIDSRIQRYIRAKEKLIALLEEYKQALIHQAVTGQIDVRTGRAYSEYKESGVEWIGRVPTYWEVAALRHRYAQSLGKMLDSKRITGHHLICYLRNIDIQWDDINVSSLPQMDIPPDEVARFTVLSGDILVCEGGEVGRAAIWNGELDVCAYQKALHRLRPCAKNQDVPRFFLYALKAAVALNAFSDGHETTIAHLTGEKLRSHRFVFPSFPEQLGIARFLDGETEKISSATIAANRSIALLSQYRTRLIADVVTGKLDVREVAAGLPDIDSIDDDSTREPMREIDTPDLDEATAVA